MQLEALQRSMMAAIDGGPGFVDESLFSGDRAAAMRGLAVHANTISHARLVALEETFPRTREQLGHGRFNALSRDFIERNEARAEPLNTIGRHFANYLGICEAPNAAVLAAFEWAWLESYHAAEDKALELADLAGAGEEELLAITVARHPAARLVSANAGPWLEDELPGIAGAAAILVTRPGADVMVSSANAPMARQFALLADPQPVCNLLAAGREQDGEDGLHALLAMLEAGSLVLSR